MSNLRRSNSSSNIPRLSRLPVRQSNVRPPRSSSARPSSTNRNLLTVYGLGTLGRSSSYSNITTPNRMIQAQTPSSSASSASKNFRMNDKEWQKAQFMRVKNFFANYDAEMPLLKPLCIRSYIHSMNILLKQLDNRICINTENYKEAVPEYLKSFKYPYSLKGSVLKTPAVPSSWQYVLQMWIWLIDLIEVFQNPQRIFQSHMIDDDRPELLSACINYMANRFKAFNNAADESEVDNDFLDNLAQIQKVNFDAPLENESTLDKELESAKETEESVNAAVVALTEEVKARRKSQAMCLQAKHDRRSELVTKINEINIQTRNGQLALNEANYKKQQLEAVIAGQTCTQAELAQLKIKIEEMQTIKRIKKECLAEQQQMIDDYTSKINQQKLAVSSTVAKFKNRIAVVSCKIPQLQGLHMPEDLDSSTFIVHVTDVDTKIKKIDAGLQTKLERFRATYTQLEQEHRMDILKQAELDAKIEEICKKEKEQTDAQNKLKDELYEEIRNAQLELEKKEKQLLQLLLKRPDVNGLKNKYDGSLKRQEELKSLQQQTMVKAWNFFVFLEKTLNNTMDDIMGKMEGINGAVEEYLTEE